MKSSIHCAINAILSGGAAKLMSNVWEPRHGGNPISHPHYSYAWFRPHYPHNDHFDIPILELYGSRWHEGILEHVYGKVRHLIEYPSYQARSAFDPFFDGTFSSCVEEWFYMAYPDHRGKNVVPQEVLDEMAKTGCFGNGWLDHRGDLSKHTDLSMKKEFEFKKHKPNTTRKHYFAHRSR